MIICSCNNLTAEQIQKAIKAGCKDCVEIMRYYNLNYDCGACKDYVKVAIDEAMDKGHLH